MRFEKKSTRRLRRVQRDPRVVGSVRIWANPPGWPGRVAGQGCSVSPGHFGSEKPAAFLFLEIRDVILSLFFIKRPCRWGGSPRSFFGGFEAQRNREKLTLEQI